MAFAGWKTGLSRAALATICVLGVLGAAGGLHAEEPAPASLPTPTAVVAPAVTVEVVEPSFVRPFIPVEQGRNDGNPLWSRSGMFLSFERSIGDKKELRIAMADGLVFQTVYHVRSAGGGDMKFFFPGVVEDISYNAAISWSPREDRFVFMSNGGEGNYDLYLGFMGGRDVVRATEHKEKDGQPDWSTAANAVVFVSGRTGKGDLYLMDVNTRALSRLTQGGKEHLYPQWSPEGKRIVFMQGNNENHDIAVISDPLRPAESLKALTAWEHDDLRPVWSPDGRMIAFYSNYNPQSDPRVWSIVVVAADGSDPNDGDGLAAKAVAIDVVPDVERGPAWMPDSSRIVYVKNDRQEYHPLYVVNVNDRSNKLFRTDTKMNHDVACGPDGTIAFRAQVDQWDQIFTAKMKE
jgi:dipeptidyl aminopeptidase/acylaminoacyl peptidase